jgi:hypothetical protein
LNAEVIKKYEKTNHEIVNYTEPGKYTIFKANNFYFKLKDNQYEIKD